MKTTNEYYTYVRFGSDPMPARGPFRSIGKAEEAMERFQARYGYRAGTYLTSGNVRLVGPFRTRKAARAADISSARTAEVK